MENKQINLVAAGIILMTLLLGVFVFAHGLSLLSGDSPRLLEYQNVVSKEPKEVILTNSTLVFRLMGILFGISGILFLASLVKKEFRKISNATLLKWALFAAILSGSIYGGLMRVISNQQGAALLFFFTMLLFLILGIVEKQSIRADTFFNSIMLLPFYAVLLYTMALPGWAKLFGGHQVIDRYVNMFKNSFIAALPGGTPLAIYGLGILELTVPVLLIISLLKGEFRRAESKPWLNYALLLCIFTFMLLCFGLAVLFNFAGSVNLVFYPLFTFLMLVYVNLPHKKQVIDNV